MDFPFVLGVLDVPIAGGLRNELIGGVIGIGRRHSVHGLAEPMAARPIRIARILRWRMKVSPLSGSSFDWATPPWGSTVEPAIGTPQGSFTTASTAAPFSSSVIPTVPTRSPIKWRRTPLASIRMFFELSPRPPTYVFFGVIETFDVEPIRLYSATSSPKRG